MKSKTSLLSLLMDATKNYRLQNQTRYQQCLSIVAICFSLHYALGLMLWSIVIYSLTLGLIRIAKPSLFWWSLWEWLPFYARCWKAATPFALSLLASYFVAERPKLAARLIWGLLIFTLVCASYDIAGEHWDMQTHDQSYGNRMNYYFTWWWCEQRSSK